MRIGRTLILILILILGLALAPGAAGQEKPPTFGEAVDVRVVNVDVFVTDKKGRRVSGLDREDFVVFQDGRPVELSNFSRIVEREVSALAPEVATPGAAGETEGAVDSEPLAQSPDQVTVVVYIDNSTLTPPHRNRVLDELEAFIVTQATDGVGFMIAVYNPGLEILIEKEDDLGIAVES